ncbi:MAG: TonB family protein [Deltaproteobacteria bacterium]|nr:TonB family protein [Deltaproteobacteria bacterium]
MTPSSETVIAGRYRIQRVLGEGGMGKLFVANDERLQRPVAVKFLHEELAARDPMFAERFRQEALAACRIRHPAVVEIYDADVHEGSPWLAMELLQGRTLGSMLAERPLTIEETVWVALEVLEGLAAVHDAGFVHRDLKPENLFLQRLARGRVQVKLLDFGIVKRLAADDATHLTATGATIGTPWYVSPEQAAGTRGLDQRSDLYSLAVIMFECLTRRRPYEADSFGALVTQFYTRPPQRLTEVLPDAPPALADLLAACLSVDRTVRPVSAHAMIDDLNALGITPRPLLLASSVEVAQQHFETVSSPGARTSSATPVRPAGGTVAMTELAAMPIARAVSPASSGAQRARSRSATPWVALGCAGVVAMGLAAFGWWRLRDPSTTTSAPVPVAAASAPSAIPGAPIAPGAGSSTASALAHSSRSMPTVPAPSLADVGLREDPTAGPPQVVVGPASVVGGSGRFAPAVVSWALAQRSDAFVACYRDALRSHGRQAGRLDVRVDLATQGTVSNASIGDSTVGSSVGDCVVAAIRPLRFSPGPEGGDVSFTCSMHFGFSSTPGVSAVPAAAPGGTR